MDKKPLVSRMVLFLAGSTSLAACIPMVVNKVTEPSATIAAVQDRNLAQPKFWGVQAFKDAHQCRIRAREQGGGTTDCRKYPDLQGAAPRTGNDTKLLQDAKTNFLVTSYYRDVESQFYPSRRLPGIAQHTSHLDSLRSWPDGLPRFCLAMSGGGIRSAAFNIGVLQALSEKGILGQFDAISAVSGGAYALGWLYAHLGDGSHATLADVLRNFSPAMGNVTKYSMFLKPSVSAQVGLTLLPWLAITLPWSMLVASSGHESIQTGNLAYEAAISITFMSQRDVPFTEIRKTVAEKGLPVPIFNVAAFDLSSSPSDMAKDTLQNVAFEFTPYRMGSYGLGFSENFAFSDGGDRLHLASVVSLSGAALDDPTSLTSIRTFLSLGTSRTESFVGTPVLASLVAATGEPRFVKDTTYLERRVLLTDGGYVDNLAAYPLLRRMCRNILIVDAEEDPKMEFTSYRCLKKRMRDEHGVEVQIEGIDRLTRPPEPECPINKAGPTNREGKEGENDRKQPDPAFIGRVSALPFPNEPPAARHGNSFSLRFLEPTIMLVKLSINRNRLDEYPPLVWAYFNACMERGRPCLFPNDPTREQSFAPDQFHAYRELGRHNAHRALARLSYSPQ